MSPVPSLPLEHVERPRKTELFVASLFTSEKRFRRSRSCPDSAAVSPANFVTLLFLSAHQGHPRGAGDNSSCLPRGLMHLSSLKHAKCFEILRWKLLARVNGYYNPVSRHAFQEAGKLLDICHTGQRGQHWAKGC